MSQPFKDSINSLKNSKTKKRTIYLQLHNYAYKHEPFDKEYANFLGREKVIAKLRSFISDTASKSGAYLVTGYRGMGKTSAVNKAVSIYQHNSTSSKYFNYFLIVLLISFINYSHLFPLIPHITLTIIGIILFLTLCLWYLVYTHPNRISKESTLEPSKILLRTNIVKLIVQIVHTNPYKTSKNAFSNTLRYIFIALLGLIYIWIFKNLLLEFTQPTNHQLFWNLSVLLCFLHVIRTHIKQCRQSENIQYTSTKYYKWFFALLVPLTIPFCLLIIAWATYGFDQLLTNGTVKYVSANLFLYINLIGPIIFIISRIHITNKSARFSPPYEGQLNKLKILFGLNRPIVTNINIGKDNLTDKDLLKYTATQFFTNYSKWYNNFTSPVIILKKSVPYIITYIALVAISTNTSIVTMNSSITSSFDVGIYLPSQALHSVDTSHNNKVLEVFQKPSSNIDEYLDNIRKLQPNFNIGYNYNGQFRSSKSIKLINTLDYYICRLYYNIRQTIIGDKFYELIPRTFDYYLLLALLLSIFIFSILDTWSLLGICTHKKSIKELELLKSKINQSITLDKGINLAPTSGGMRFPIFFRKSSSKILPMDSKDIEAELIRILNNIAHIPAIFVKVQPIFIYDELDKITPHPISKLQSDSDDDSGSDINYHTKRQETVTAIMASLKNFLTSSPAKFIFIAGRDMYDASLAGISDRQSVLDSIFNDNKIYINSFYTEPSASINHKISSYTEKYICQFLLDPCHIDGEDLKNDDFLDLEKYRDYLRTTFQKPDHEDAFIVNNLYNLVKYITYRSNGAPKKISNLLEQFIHPVGGNHYQDKAHELTRGISRTALFLTLTPNDQYRLSYISFLVTPTLLRLSSYTQDYGDKTLVSMSYLLDHIYKFHRFSFSMRSLSLAPEMLDINKEPDFRNMLVDTINSLSTSHLRPIISGLHQYKFNNKIRIELQYLTKVNNLEAAALNFTLDESIEIKRYVNQKINRLRKEYGLKTEYNKVGYIQSLSYYYMTLGDLHFFDQQYSDAISNYQEAITLFGPFHQDQPNEYLFYEIVRNNLKLALAYEKEGMYTAALIKYSQLSDTILRNRDFAPSIFGLEATTLSITEYEDLKKINRVHTDLMNATPFKNETDKAQDCNFIVRREKTNGNSDLSAPIAMVYDTDGSHIARNQSKFHLNSRPYLDNFKLTNIENIRLLYQPMIAKLHLLEKSAPNGITTSDLNRTLEEFEFLIRTIDTLISTKAEFNNISDEQYKNRLIYSNVIVTEFYNKIGDVLFYVNGSLYTHDRETEIDGPLDALHFYLKAWNNIDKDFDYSLGYNINDLTTLLNNVITTPAEAHNITSSEFYINNIYSFIYKEKSRTSIINRNNPKFINALCNTLIDICDSYYCIVKGDQSTIFTTLVRCYLVVADMFEAIGEYRLAKSQIIKAIFIIQTYPDLHKIFDPTPEDPTSGEFLKNILKAKELVYKTYGYSTMQRDKLSQLIPKNNSPISTKTNPVSQHELMEIELLHLNYKLKIVNLRVSQNEAFSEEEFKALVDHIATVKEQMDEYENETSLTRQYNILHLAKIRAKYNSMLIKVLEITFEDNINIEKLPSIPIYQYLINIAKNKITYMKTESDGDDVAEEFNDHKRNIVQAVLLNNSIEALSEVVKIHDILGPNYVTTGNLNRAKVHFKMHTLILDLQDTLGKINDNVTAETRSIIEHFQDSSKFNPGNPNYNAFFHLSLAEKYNAKAYEMHNRNTEYMTFINSTYYLDDDLNDNIVHFGIARERANMKIKSKVFEDELKDEEGLKDWSPQKLTKKYFEKKFEDHELFH